MVFEEKGVFGGVLGLTLPTIVKQATLEFALDMAGLTMERTVVPGPADLPLAGCVGCVVGSGDERVVVTGDASGNILARSSRGWSKEQRRKRFVREGEF